MFKRAGNPLAPHLRRLYRRASSSTHPVQRNVRAHPGLAISATAVAAYALWSNAHIHNDAVSPISTAKTEPPQALSISGGNVADSEELRTVVWGSNRSGTLTPDDIKTIRTPSVAEWLDGVALRDLALHQDHAACVDARGDVYQWGSKFAGPDENKPRLTLREKNITQLRLTEGRVYALSASGKVYALSAEASKQELKPGTPTPSSDGWWGTGWFWGEDETVDFIEITPNERLAWGEKFTSIQAGDDHLLALTSKGRAFAHPVNKNANAYGQLGFRKFKVPDPSLHHRPGAASHLLDVELIPKAVADPYANFSRSSRPSPAPTTSGNLVGLDDKNIRFCPHLFEIPVLKDIEIAQVAAGGRSSFARTATGRVLGWGANDHGQLGLGRNMVVDTVITPTEIILWKSSATQATSSCLDISAGGDLTAFTVEITDEPSSTTIDLLMCGNGQWGGLGNNLYTSAQIDPLRAKCVSGLVEYNDSTKSLQPIAPHAVNISPTSHVLLTLNPSSSSNVGGKDLFVWGRNYEYELGNGKRVSIPIPTTLETAEGGRLLLRGRRADVKDLHGKVWKRRVQVQQEAVAGFETSAVYWKISQ